MVGWGGFLGVFLCIPKLLFDVFFQPAAEFGYLLRSVATCWLLPVAEK